MEGYNKFIFIYVFPYIKGYPRALRSVRYFFVKRDFISFFRAIPFLRKVKHVTCSSFELCLVLRYLLWMLSSWEFNKSDLGYRITFFTIDYLSTFLWCHVTPLLFLSFETNFFLFIFTHFLVILTESRRISVNIWCVLLTNLFLTLNFYAGARHAR